MRQAVSLWALFFLCLASIATAGERRLHGQVLTLDENNHRNPVGKNIEVVIEQIGSTHYTDASGLFDYLLRDLDRPNKEITFQVVTLREKYIVQDPLDGYTRIPKDNKLDELIRLQLVRKGSPALLTDQRFKKSVDDENVKARDQVKLGKAEQRLPVKLTFEETASKLGFTQGKLLELILKLAAELENSPDFELQARAAAVMGDFKKAGKLEMQAMESRVETYTRKLPQKQPTSQQPSNRGIVRLVKEAIPLQGEDHEELALELVKGFRFAGDAYYNAYEFKDALSAYERALEYVSKEETPELWAAIHMDIGRAHVGITVQVEGTAIHDSLKEGFAAFDAALQVFTKDAFPQQWALTKNYLSIALLAQSNITSGKDTIQALFESGEACEAALTVFTKDVHPQQWAMTQVNLGLVRLFQSNTTIGEARARLLAQALEDYRAALTVYSKDAFPQQWALTQINLGTGLLTQARDNGGKESHQLFTQSIEAYEAALTVFTKDAFPQQWAIIQVNLGTGLLTQGGNIGGTEGLKLLAQAVCDYKAALTVFTREDLPFYWAMIQVNLGSVRRVQGSITGGEDRARVFTEAIKAYQDALTIYTKDALPQQWAMTQANLGNVLAAKGATMTGVLQSWLQATLKRLYIIDRDAEVRRFSPKESRQLHTQADEAYKAALTVYTKDVLPHLWATTQISIGTMLIAHSKRASGQESCQLLAQAADTYRSLLIVYPKDAFPDEWASAQDHLGTTLIEQGICSGGKAGHTLILQAIAAFELALQVRTREVLPVQWERTTANLNRAIYALPDFWTTIQTSDGTAHVNRGSGEESCQLLAQAVDIYRSLLTAYPKDVFPKEWASVQDLLGIAFTEQGICTGGEVGRVLIDQEGIHAFELASQVRTGDALARTTANRGKAKKALEKMR